MSYRRDVTTTGSRDRFLLVVRYAAPRVIEQRAYANRDERDAAAKLARREYGRDAVTCDFVRNYGGRAVTRVWL